MLNLNSITKNLKWHLVNLFVPRPFISGKETSTAFCIYMIPEKNTFQLNPDNPYLCRVEYQPHLFKESMMLNGNVPLCFNNSNGEWQQVPQENIMMVDTVHHEIILLVPSVL